jgi:hypothetical protein
LTYSQKHWLDLMPTTEERTTNLKRIPDLIKGGNVFQAYAKNLYDYGVLFCTDMGYFKPVSSLAADVLFELFVRNSPIGSDPSHHSYWKNLEDAVIKSICTHSQGHQIKVFTMDGTSEKFIPLGAYKSKPLPGTSFAVASKHIVQDEKNSILYIPQYEKSTCDALLIPPAGSADPIVVIDMSTGEPYGPKRSKKYKTWCKTVVPVLNTIFRSHEVVCVAVWPEKYTRAQAESRIKNKFEKANKEAIGKTYLLEKEEMVRLFLWKLDTQPSDRASI